MKKLFYNLFITILVILFQILINSCDGLEIPFENKNGFFCDTIPSWLFEPRREYFPLREVATISKDQNIIYFEYIGGGAYYSKISNKLFNIPYKEISSNNDFQYYEQMVILPCPYDNYKVMIIIVGYNSENKRISHWYIYDVNSKVPVKITPNKYRNIGLNEESLSWLRNPLTWLSSSSEGNDFIYNPLGVFHLQNEEYSVRITDDISIVSVSPDGRYKWHGFNNIKYGDKEKSGWFLNNKKIDGVKLSYTDLFTSKSNSIKWSSDSKFIAIVGVTDTRNPLVTLPELHIINVEKTYNEGKIVIEKTINLRDSYCVFRSGLTCQITTTGKVLLSMSYNQKDAGILYEVDINTGQRTPLVFD